MKSRTSNLMIGSLTLVFIAGAIGAILGYQKFAAGKQRIPLRVVFEGSASGLNKGGSVNFGGIRVGEVVSLTLDNPRRVVALAMIDNSAPIRKDTSAGLEFQGLTGVAALSLTGGSAEAPPVPLDADGVPILIADPDATQDVQTKIKAALQNVNRAIADNRADLQDTLRNFETFSASLSANGEQIDAFMRSAQSGVGAVDTGVSKTLDLLASLGGLNAENLQPTVKSARTFARDFNRRSGIFINDGRVLLNDISASINNGKLGGPRR